jgi:hypothetical protein
MLKMAYQIGFEAALKEAGMSPDDFEKLAKFLWYRDLAEAFPTFRRWMGLSPEMGHRVMQAGKKVAPAARKSVSRPAHKGMATFRRGAFAKAK